MRWLLSIVCLVLLGAVLLADAQTTTYAPGSSNAPEQFQIIKAVGEDDLDTSSPTGSQSAIWVNWTNPVNQGNAPPSEFGVDVASTGGTTKYTCSSVNAIVANAGPATGGAGCYGMILRYFDQNIQEGVQYTIAAYAVNSYGEGVRTSSQVVTVPLGGTPRQPTNLAISYTSATSFVLSFYPPIKLGQTGATGSGNVANFNQLQTPFFQVQIRSSTGSSLTAWTPVTFYTETTNGNNANAAIIPFSAGPFSQQTCVVSGTGATSSSSILQPSTGYVVRARAVGQWGFGPWSSTATVTTQDGKQSPNKVGQPTVVAAASAGGLISWTSPQLTGGAITGWKVETAAFNNGGVLYNAFSTPTGTPVTDTAFGRVSGGHVLISALTTTQNGAAITTYRVRVLAQNANGDGTAALDTASQQTLTLSAAANPTLGTAPVLVACWSVTGGNTINCLANTTAATVIGNGGFGATPYTFGNPNNVAGATGTVSMGASDLTGTVTFNATAAGTVTLVATNATSGTVSSNIVFVTSLAVTAPTNAVWFNRSGTAVTDVNGFVTVGNNFVVLNVGSPTQRGVVATAATGTNVGGVNAVGFFAGTNAASNGAAVTDFQYLDGTTSSTVLSAAKFVVAVRSAPSATATVGVNWTLVSGGTAVQLYCCAANVVASNGAGVVPTGAGSNAGALTAANAITVIDITDTSLTFVITLTAAGASYTANQANVNASSAASVYGFTATGTANVRGVSVASGLTTTANSNQPATAHLDGWQVTLSGLLPGRQYFPQVAFSVTNAASTNAAAAASPTGTNFYTATTRGPAATAGSNAIYYIGSTQATIWLQLPTDLVGQGGLSSQTPGATASTFQDINTSLTVLQTTNLATGTTANRAFVIGDAGPTTVTAASVSSGTWRGYTLSALAAANASTGQGYTINVWTESQVNRSAAAWSGTLTTSGTDATKVSTAATTLSSTLRYVTSTSAWVEWEGVAANVGVIGAASWYVKSDCGTGAVTVVTTIADLTDFGIPAGSSGLSRNRVLVKVTGLTGTSCAISTAYNNGSGTPGANGANLTFSTAVTVTLASGAPATPTGYTVAPYTGSVDQVTSTSFVVAFNYPATFGTGDTTAAPTAAYTVTNASTDQPAITTGATGAGTIATSFYGLFSFNSGFYQQITGFTVSGTANNFVAATQYTAKIRVTVNNNTTASAAGSLQATTDNNGSVPAAPTGVAYSRLFSTGVRLNFSTPISVGGSNTATSSATQGNLSTPTPNLSAYRVVYSTTSASSVTAATAGSAVNIDTSSIPSTNGTGAAASWSNNLSTYYIDVTGLPAGTSVNLQICASNQFSIAFPTSPFNPAGTTANPVTCAFSTAINFTTPAASGVVPNPPTSLAVTQYGLTNIFLQWTIPQNFGSNAVTVFTIFRGQGSATPVSVGTVTLPAGWATTAAYTADTTLTANTSYTYQVYATATSTNSATAAGPITQTTHNTNDAPIAPAAPTLAAGIANSQGTNSSAGCAAVAGTLGVGFSGNCYQDTITSISWASPIGIGGTSINGYVVTQNTSNCNRTYTWTTTTTNFNFPTIPGKSYTYAVQATNTRSDSGVTSTQNGAQSGTLSQIANSIVRPYPLPALTTGGSAGTTGSGYATFTLSTPSTVSGTQYSLSTSDGFANFVGVQVLVQNLTNVTSTTFVPDSFVNQITGSLGSTTSSLLVNGLTSNTKYRIGVASFNGYQTAWSASAITITTATSPQRPSGITSLSSNLLLKRSTSIWLSWGQPQETGGQGFVNQWQVSWRAATASTLTQNTTSVMQAVIRGLTDATNYFVDVRGINGIGTSTTQATFGDGILGNGLNNNVLTGQVPNDQTNFAVTSNTGTAIAFSWTTATGASTAISGQALTGASGTTASNPAVAVGATDTTASVTVVNGNFYRFFLNATNSIGTGNNSVSIYIQASPVTTTGIVPAAGTPSLDFYAANEYRVSWTAVGSGTTAAATYYLVYWQWTTRFLASTGNPAAADGLGMNTAVLGSGTNPAIAGTCVQLFQTIKPSSRYRMVLIGGNTVGLGQGSQGTASNNIGTPTQGALTQTGQAAAPAAPTQGTNTNTSITVNFATPVYTGLGLITSYQIQTFPENGGNVILGYKNATDSTSSSRANYTFTQANLQPGTPYVVNVRAINSFGQSIPSANLRVSTTGGAGFAATSSLWTVVLMAIAALLAFAF